MRGRLIRPGYWTDADLQMRCKAEVREFYIGLWMESDDAGYVAWDMDRLGAELYPFRSPVWRRAHLPAYVTSLNSHVQLLDCGKHLLIPKLTQHQIAPRPSFQNQRAHDKCLRHMVPDAATWDHMVPALKVKERERGLKGGPEPNEETVKEPGITDFQRQVARP